MKWTLTQTVTTEKNADSRKSKMWYYRCVGLSAMKLKTAGITNRDSAFLPVKALTHIFLV